MPAKMTPERFQARVEIVENGCWRWKGPLDLAGYGRTGVRHLRPDGKIERMAYRVALMLFVGPILPGLTIDHLCRWPACVNPAHLEAVTQGVNNIRGDSPFARHARQTHCVQGHPFDEANTRIERRRNGLTFRRCVACKRQRLHDWYVRHKKVA